jgi:hypothetical protein
VTYGPQSVGAVNGLPVRPGLLLSVPSGMDHLLVTGEDRLSEDHANLPHPFGAFSRR